MKTLHPLAFIAIIFAFAAAPIANADTPTPPVITEPLDSERLFVPWSCFTLTASATGNPAPSFQWQVSTDNGAHWDNLADMDYFPYTYFNTNTPSLSINSDPTLNNCRYRYIANNGIGAPVASNALTLKLAPDTFLMPIGIARDTAGNLYVSDFVRQTIIKVTPQLTATIFAGNPQADPNSGGFIDATGTAAGFRYPSGIAFDKNGNLLVTDAGNQAIRKITPDAVVTTLATGFIFPSGIAVDASNNAYIADPHAHTISKMSPTGIVTPYAGATGEYGAVVGIGANARFRGPQAVLIDPQGHLYIADTGNNLIRTQAADGTILIYAGGVSDSGTGISGTTDGYVTDARFNHPCGMTADNAGHIYLADAWNHTIRMISNDGEVMTLAGTPGKEGLRDGTGTNALFCAPADLTYDGAGTLYVVDGGNSLIRKIDITDITAPKVTTLLITTATTTGSAGIPGADGKNNNSDGGGGGGTLSLWWLGALVALLSLRACARRECKM